MYNTIMVAQVQIPSTHVRPTCAFYLSTGRRGQRRELLGFAACLSLSGKHLQVSERPCLKGSSRTPDILLWQGIPWMCVCTNSSKGKCRPRIGGGCRPSRQGRSNIKENECCCVRWYRCLSQRAWLLSGVVFLS